MRPVDYAVERKKRLKALSKEKTNRFPDTLEAMRDRKQNFIKMKKEAEEEARRQIDREEAKFQRDQRNNIIKKAEEAFFNQTDRMKLLLSRQAIAETIHERKKQIEERKVNLIQTASATLTLTPSSTLTPPPPPTPTRRGSRPRW